MSIGSEKDLIALRKIGKIVATTRDEMLQSIESGITTKELDAIGDKVLRRYGARSAPKFEYGFPGTTCISINDEVAHGISSRRVIKEGDLVNVDVSAELDGYFADTGATFIVAPMNSINRRLCECSKSALFKGIAKVKAGTKINQIGKEIFNETKGQGFTVIKNLTGHGIGKRLHEEPQNILNYFDVWDNQVLTDGLVLAIETFVSTGAEYVKEESNGWTLKTPDGSMVAQFEHTIVVTKDEPIILTT